MKQVTALATSRIYVSFQSRASQFRPTMKCRTLQHCAISFATLIQTKRPAYVAVNPANISKAMLSATVAGAFNERLRRKGVMRSLSIKFAPPIAIAQAARRLRALQYFWGWPR